MWLFLLLFNLGLYPKTLVVTETDTARDVVVCEDYNGNVWEFEGVEDWETGDIVSAIMDSKGTEEVHDDEFVVCRYGGNVFARKEWQDDGSDME